MIGNQLVWYVSCIGSQNCPVHGHDGPLQGQELRCPF